MVDYTVIINSAGIIMSIRRDDGASIPVCEGNRDYQRYLEDVENGATVDEQVIPEPDQSVSIEDRVAALELAEIERELGL